MKRALRILIWVTGVLLVVLICLALILPVALGPAVKRAAEYAGPAVAGVPVEITDVRIQPWKGSAMIDGLVVGAPQGFKANLAELGSFSMKLRLSSLLSDTIVLEEIIIRDPVVTYELSGTRSNIGALLGHMKSDDKEEKETQKKEKTDESEGKKVIIEHFLFEKGRVRLATSLTGGKGVVLPLPKIELHDFGKERKGGLGAVEATRELVGVVSVAVLSVVKDGVVGIAGLGADAVTAIAGAAGDGLSMAGDLAGTTLKAVGDLTGSAIKGVGDVATEGVQAVGKGVKIIGGAAGGAIRSLGGVLGKGDSQESEKEDPAK